MAGTEVKTRGTGMRGSDVAELVTQHTNIVNYDLPYLTGNRVISNNGVGAGLSSDATAQDIETDNDILIQVGGSHFKFAAVAALDLSVSGSLCTVPGAATISTSKAGTAWVFAHPDGTLDAQTDITTAAWATAIASLAQYAAVTTATRLLPLSALHVPIGAVQVTEGGSGAYTWGTDSIAGETETFYDFITRPVVLTEAASLALDAAAATFTYGAGKGILGSGVYVSYTGKANVALPTNPAGTISDKKVGAWLIYVLADDSEYAFQLGADYATLTAAQAAVKAHTRNPLLIWIGTMYVDNQSGSNFTPATTNLDAAGIKTTFEIQAATTMIAANITTYA